MCQLPYSSEIWQQTQEQRKQRQQLTQKFWGKLCIHKYPKDTRRGGGAKTLSDKRPERKQL